MPVRHEGIGVEAEKPAALLKQGGLATCIWELVWDTTTGNNNLLYTILEPI